HFFFQAEDGIRDFHVTGVQTCALPIWQQPSAPPTGTDGTTTVAGTPGTWAFTCRARSARNEAMRQAVYAALLSKHGEDHVRVQEIGRASCRARGQVWEGAGGVEDRGRR